MVAGNIIQVGERIRDLREIFDYSPEQAALITGVDEATYLRYENGETDIPIGFLYEVANAYHVELTVLLTGNEPKLSRYAISRQNGGVEVKRHIDYEYRSLAYNYHDKVIEPLYVAIQPDAPEVPIAINDHPGQEWDYILSGKMLLQLGDRSLILGPGDSIYFDSSMPHGMKAIEGKLEFLAIVIEPKQGT